jgi:hypothetical protein
MFTGLPSSPMTRRLRMFGVRSSRATLGPIHANRSLPSCPTSPIPSSFSE